MSKVCIVKCLNYDRENVETAIGAAFGEIGAVNLFKQNEKILLKPNMLSGKSPDKAVTTHPEIIRAVAHSLRNCGIKMTYGDSPASDAPDKAARICGISQVMDQLGIEFSDFTDSFRFENPNGETIKKFNFVKAVADNDGIINIAKFKTHALTGFTGSLKNLFGLIPGYEKAKEHVRFPNEIKFSEMLADMNKCLNTRLHIIDAVVGMEGNGPANGNPRDIHMILMSVDPVALDSICASIMGLNPLSLDIISTAQKRGLGTADLSEIELRLIDDATHPDDVRRAPAKELIDELVIHDFKNALHGFTSLRLLNTSLGKFVKKLVINRPAIIHDNCTKCKVCVKVCPVEPKAIYFSEKNNRIEYHYEKCIRCFCCQELCPFAAIKVEKAPLHFLVRAPHERKK